MLLLFNDPLTLPEIYIELLVETLVFLRLPALDFKDGLWIWWAIWCEGVLIEGLCVGFEYNTDPVLCLRRVCYACGVLAPVAIAYCFNGFYF